MYALWVRHYSILNKSSQCGNDLYKNKYVGLTDNGENWRNQLGKGKLYLGLGLVSPEEDSWEFLVPVIYWGIALQKR
jgi:hypothetical protein